MSKGDTPRPMDKEAYDANFERVFGEHKIKTWTDAPRFAEEGGESCGEGTELPKEPNGQCNPKPPESVEGAGPPSVCPLCGESTSPWVGYSMTQERICGTCGWIGVI